MHRARSIQAALVGVAALGLGGCVQASDDVTVKNDGSGSYTESMELDLNAMTEMRAAMKEMMSGFPGGPGGPGRPPGAGMDGGDKPPTPGDGATPTEPVKPPEAPKLPEDPLEKMKARWKDIPGLEVTKSTSEMKDGKATLHVEANFKTLEAYAQASGLDMGADLVKNEDGSYTLKFEGKFGMGRGPGRPDGAPHDGPGMGEEPPAGMDGAPPAGMDGDAPRGPGGMDMGARMKPLVEQFMKGLKLTRKLKLPGTVGETNGTKSEDGSTVTWTVTYEDILAGKVAPQAVTFKGEGLDLKPFVVKRSARRSFMGGGGMPPGGGGMPPGGGGMPPGGGGGGR